MNSGTDDMESARDGFIMKDSNGNSIFGKEFNGYLNEKNTEKGTVSNENMEMNANGGNVNSKRKKLSEDEPEQVLLVMSRLVQELFESLMMIKKLEAEMNRNLGLEDHFKEVIRSQRERFREDVRKNLNFILMGYDKMLENCANPKDAASKISKMTRLAVEEVESVISLCLQLEDRGQNRGPNDYPGKYFLKFSGREFCVDYSKSLEIIQKKTVVNSKNSNNVGTSILSELLQNTRPGQHRSGPSRENVPYTSYVHNIEHTENNSFWQQNQRESMKGFRQPPETTLPSEALNLLPQYVDSSNSNKAYPVPPSNPTNYVINGNSLKHFNRYSSLPFNHAVSAQLPYLPVNCVPQSVVNTCPVQTPVQPLPPHFLRYSNSYIDQRDRSQRISATSLQQTTCYSPRGLVTMPSNQRSNGQGPLTQELRPRIPSDSSSTKNTVNPNSQNSQYLGRYASGRCVDRPFHHPLVTAFSGFEKSLAASSVGLPPLTGNREAGAPVSAHPEQSPSVSNVGEILVQVSFEHLPKRAATLPLEPSTDLAHSTKRTDRSQPLLESSRGTGPPERPPTNYNAKEQTSNEAAGKNYSNTRDPTIPQKLTLKDHRLQAGITLETSRPGDSDAEVNRREPEVVNLEEEVSIKTEKEDEDDVQIIDEVDNSNNSYNTRVTRVRMCAQGECTNIGVRICKGCCSVIYCSDTCQLKHWRLKHKEECEKLKELRVD